MSTWVRAVSVDIGKTDAPWLHGVATERIDGVDLCARPDDLFTGDRLAELLRAAAPDARDDGLRVVSVTAHRTPAEVTSENPAIRRPVVRAFRAMTVAAGEVGAALCAIPPPDVGALAETGTTESTGGPGDTGGSADVRPVRYADALNGTFKLLGALADTAACAGVTIGLRAPCHRCLLSPVEVRELIDAVHTPAVGVCVELDAVTAIGDVDDWLDTLRHRVVGVRASSAAAHSEPYPSSDVPARADRADVILEADCTRRALAAVEILQRLGVAPGVVIVR